jgi:hypothetical protein
MSRTPQPEFGKPETGRLGYWSRLASIDRLNDPEVQTQMHERRVAAAESRRRAKHRHYTCPDCAAGLVDVGIHERRNGGVIHVASDGESRQCCTCLALVRLAVGHRLVASVPGPNTRLYRCRVLDPEPSEESATS